MYYIDTDHWTEDRGFLDPLLSTACDSLSVFFLSRIYIYIHITLTSSVMYLSLSTDRLPAQIDFTLANLQRVASIQHCRKCLSYLSMLNRVKTTLQCPYIIYKKADIIKNTEDPSIDDKFQ